MKFTISRSLMGTLAVIAMLAAPALADPITYTWATDPSNDAAGGSTFETYGIGYSLQDSRLYFAVRTSFPESGAYTGDSYSHNTKINPGDLYINVDGSLESGTGAVFGIGFTKHRNEVKQAYSGQWPKVKEGKLYTGAVFADGTYERYDKYLLQHGMTPTPADADSSKYVNSHPTLIRAYTDELSGVSDADWNSVSGEAWCYQIEGWVDTSAFGSNQPESHIELRWSMECGNDAIMAVVPVPEPGTFLAIGSLGCLAAAARLRRRRRKAETKDA